jgi:hypothetical protein
LQQLANLAPVSTVTLQAASIVLRDAEQQERQQARQQLREARHHPQALLRRVAFRALGESDGPLSQLEPGLYDGDVSVRLAAAGALLRASFHAL